MKTALSFSLFVGLFGVCSLSQAFTPANGLWRIDAEQNGLPGRGLRINVENEIVVLTYYGYRTDGTSLFLLAAGKMAGNTFSGTLQEYKDGVSLGESIYHSATAATSPGTVTVTFSSGTHGTITLPGEAAKAISNIPFGYPRTPDGLMGTYLFVYGTSTLFSEVQTLTRYIGIATSYGNGVVVNAANTFACENGINSLDEWVICTDSNDSQYDDNYLFKLSGDRGTGVGTWKANGTNYYPLDVIRRNTASGRTTGINEATITSLRMYAAPVSDTVTGTDNASSKAATLISAKSVAMSEPISLPEEQQEAFASWRERLRDSVNLLKYQH